MGSVQITDLVIKYGDVTAVDGLTMSVAPGEIVGLLGGNGAGKSSTLRAIAGVNPPTSGTLTVAGHDMASPDGVERGRQVLGYCPDVGGLIRQATVREHVALALALHGRHDLWPEAMNLVEEFDLLRAFERPTHGFSHGMSRRLSVVLAALTAHDLLILDEPFDGVDPMGVAATMNVIDRASKAGLAVLISTHLLDLIVEASDRVVVMVSGRIVDEGDADSFAGPSGKQRYARLLDSPAVSRSVIEPAGEESSGLVPAHGAR